ncbi:unnamed protein product, partial [Effrenium voratum]
AHDVVLTARDTFILVGSWTGVQASRAIEEEDCWRDLFAPGVHNSVWMQTQKEFLWVFLVNPKDRFQCLHFKVLRKQEDGEWKKRGDNMRYLRADENTPFEVSYAERQDLPPNWIIGTGDDQQSWMQVNQWNLSKMMVATKVGTQTRQALVLEMHFGSY